MTHNCTLFFHNCIKTCITFLSLQFLDFIVLVFGLVVNEKFVKAKKAKFIKRLKKNMNFVETT